MGRMSEPRNCQVEMEPPERGIAETPPALADIVAQAIKDGIGSSWLDPCAGNGQLVSAAIQSGIPNSAILAIDLQTELPNLRALNVECKLGIDFLEWSVATRRRFDGIFANPPYVRLREVHPILARNAQNVALPGVDLGMYSNYWVAFLIAGMNVLKPGGSLAYILPAAWQYASYAETLRNYCKKSFRELEMHRVEVPMFDEVDDGSILLIGRGYGEKPLSKARLMTHDSLASLARYFAAPRTLYNGLDIWDTYHEEIGEGEVRVGDIAEIRIGAVTGHARYFLLRESERQDLRIPLSSVVPILSKASHLRFADIDSRNWDDLKNCNERVWLFNPIEKDMNHPSVRSYLELSEEQGGCRREATKIRNRIPWYRVAIPDPFHGFVSGMSRQRTWITLNRHPGLTASNTLYGVRFLDIGDVDQQAAWSLAMLSTRSWNCRLDLARRYPQGLMKLEPSDFARIIVPRPLRRRGALDLYRKAIDLMHSGRVKAVREFVDSWVKGEG